MPEKVRCLPKSSRSLTLTTFPREISSAVKSEREQLLAWRRKASWIKDCWFPTKSLTICYLEKLEDKKNGFLLDGYPRTLDQAKAFDALAEGSELAIDKVIALEIDFEKLADRVTGRRICKECGEIYHIKSKPSKTDNVCDVCGGELFQRKDDTVESLTVRLEEYSSQTAPVLDYYDSKGIVTRIDASQPIDSVWNDTLTALEK